MGGWLGWGGGCSLGRWVVGLAGEVGAHWVGGYLLWPGGWVLIEEVGGWLGWGVGCSLGR